MLLGSTQSKETPCRFYEISKKCCWGIIVGTIGGNAQNGLFYWHCREIIWLFSSTCGMLWFLVLL